MITFTVTQHISFSDKTRQRKSIGVNLIHSTFTCASNETPDTWQLWRIDGFTCEATDSHYVRDDVHKEVSIRTFWLWQKLTASNVWWMILFVWGSGTLEITHRHVKTTALSILIIVKACHNTWNTLDAHWNWPMNQIPETIVVGRSRGEVLTAFWYQNIKSKGIPACDSVS